MHAATLLCLALVAGCTREAPDATRVGPPSPSPEVPRHPEVARLLDAGVPADADLAPDAAVVALPRVMTFASIDELFGLADRAPSDRLAGYQLGAPPGDDGFRRITITGWGEGSTGVQLDAAGRVRQITIELVPEIARQEGRDVYERMGAILEAVEARLRARWGKPRGASWPTWRGPRGQLAVTTYGGFLRGTPSLVANLIGPGEAHVCGARDGFAAFFARFRAAVVRGDAVELARHLDTAPNDMAGCAELTGKPLVACLAPVVKNLVAHRASPACHLSRGVYTWQTVEEFHGGSYFLFTRDAARRWRAHGPIGIGHDDGLDPSAP